MIMWTSWAAFSHARNHRRETCLCVNRWSGNPAIPNVATLLSGGFEIAPIRFPMSENIFVDTKIMFICQLGDKLCRKTQKMIIFGGFLPKKFFYNFFFWKPEKPVFNRPRVKYFGQRKSCYLKNCSHSASLIHNKNIYQPNIRITTKFVNQWVGGDWNLKTGNR